MSKLSDILGANYEKNRREMNIKTFDLGGHQFKVRIPLVAESDAMYLAITNPDESYVTKIYEQITESLHKFKDQENLGLEITNDDISISGRSMREAARNKAMTEIRITEYVKLLVAENPNDTLESITYTDIESEWPLSVQIALADKIGEIISPTYKELRGN